MFTDFIIIGSGIAGMSAAYRLSDHGKVIVIEKEAHLGYHTTGRSAAFFTENYGNKTIRALTKASRYFLENPTESFLNNPLMSLNGGVLMIANSNQIDAVEKELKYANENSAKVFEISKKEALKMVPALKENYLDRALHEPYSKVMDVDLIHQGYARGAKINETKIYFNQEVISISKDKNLWNIKTKNEVYSALLVINAAVAWCDEIALLANCKPLGIKPKRRTIIIFKNTDNYIINQWPVVIDINDNFYFKPESGKFLASPADETDSPPCDAQPEEIDIALTVERLEKATNLKIKNIEHKWAGLRSFYPDRTPVVGEDNNNSGFFWLAGQGGYGIMTSPSISKILESLITGKKWPKKLEELSINENTLSPNRFI